MVFDPENDSPDEQEFDISELDVGDEEEAGATCPECGDPLSFGECTNPTCPESPDFADDSLDEDDIGEDDA